MGFIESLLHPKSFLTLTDLRNGTMIIAGINFILIALNFGAGGSFFRVLYNIIITVLSLLCTGLGCWGAFKKITKYVTWYFYFTFINFCFAVVGFVTNIVAFSILGIIVSAFHLIIGIYTVTVVRGFLTELGSDPAAGIV
ncbi:hypothetical protein BCR36DRAFT_579503 [Piromyces finnis]|uniref:Uncharacterized protein n=1 Tax=Piromyces finnis TaxID=1754191 RepID=A0A1Y1VN67_9FUNG|nr:hypothetical protein BCR36DRAFT_579503 [Piromyces finnis]|eukprot:ORX60062.1 hypothetical protein BCR36DRAFT_579503 [Piromyces finnis]